MEKRKLHPSLWNLDGVNYFHVKVVGLLFAATARINMSPSLALELILQRIARVIKYYLGVLNEESLRKNFVLVHELLDEVIDFGYVQTTSTEVLKSYLFNEPIVIDAARLPTLGPAALFMVLSTVIINMFTFIEHLQHLYVLIVTCKICWS